jgi:hypothetical protein
MAFPFYTGQWMESLQIFCFTIILPFKFFASCILFVIFPGVRLKQLILGHAIDLVPLKLASNASSALC